MSKQVDFLFFKREMITNLWQFLSRKSRLNATTHEQEKVCMWYACTLACTCERVLIIYACFLSAKNSLVTCGAANKPTKRLSGGHSNGCVKLELTKLCLNLNGAFHCTTSIFRCSKL